MASDGAWTRTEEPAPAAAPVATNDIAPAPAAELLSQPYPPEEIAPATAETAPAAAETAPPPRPKPHAPPTAPAAAETVPVETQPSAAAPAAPAPSKADVRRLERGHMRDGIAAARANIEADPSDAEPTCFWAPRCKSWAMEGIDGGLQSMRRTATKGPKGECRALRGR